MNDARSVNDAQPVDEVQPVNDADAASAASNDAGEPARQRLDRRARTLWAALGAGGALAVGVAGGVALVVVGGPWPVAVVLTPLLLLGATGAAMLHWGFWWWGTGDEALELGHGVVIRHASYVPFHRIQQIDVERGPLERALGLARLTVHTASATTDASIPGLALEEARALRRHLLERAGRDDGV